MLDLQKVASLTNCVKTNVNHYYKTKSLLFFKAENLLFTSYCLVYVCMRSCPALDPNRKL